MRNTIPGAVLPATMLVRRGGNRPAVTARREPIPSTTQSPANRERCPTSTSFPGRTARLSRS